MFYLIQVYKMITNKALFISLFNDLSYEINELGYSDLFDQFELINELLDTHFGLYIEDFKQLQKVGTCILSNQGRLDLLLRNFN